ncbi:MAG: aminotransferase class I/II-fold pyridoxal phosphate-dependent enzyme, partial [Parabacteroides sp.]
IFLCSPNNPSGNSLSHDKIHQVLDNFEGITVIDEAYIDFSSQPTYLKELKKYPNLIVLQTLSKAWGAAGLRLGIAFASPEIIVIMSNVKYPYNVNVLTQRHALEVLNSEADMKKHLRRILDERTRLQNALPKLACVRKVYPTDANFILTDVGDANAVYSTLMKKGVIVRNRTNVTLCEGCLRITVGTSEENDTLLSVLKEIKA